jgi:hypothetical protein
MPMLPRSGSLSELLRSVVESISLTRAGVARARSPLPSESLIGGSAFGWWHLRGGLGLLERRRGWLCCHKAVGSEPGGGQPARLPCGKWHAGVSVPPWRLRSSLDSDPARHLHRHPGCADSHLHGQEMTAARPGS